jgi:hypothetical protein
MRLEPGMLAGKGRQKWRDVAASQIDRSPQPQHASGRPAPGCDLGFRIAHVLQERPASFVEEQTFIGEAKAAGAALGKPHAELCLQPAQSPADRGRRRSKCERAGRNPSGINDGAEQSRIGDIVQSLPP